MAARARPPEDELVIEHTDYTTIALARFFFQRAALLEDLACTLMLLRRRSLDAELTSVIEAITPALRDFATDLYRMALQGTRNHGADDVVALAAHHSFPNASVPVTRT